MTSGERIKKLRERLGLSQSEFARRLNYSRAFIHQLEKGIRNPDLSVLQKISETFNVPLSELIGEKDKFVITLLLNGNWDEFENIYYDFKNIYKSRFIFLPNNVNKSIDNFINIIEQKYVDYYWLGGKNGKI
jgi:transcriptional regulator with XRE-family HTH domain